MGKSTIRRLAIFAHYDKDDIVDNYVYYYLEELKKVCSVVHCVSTAKLNTAHIEQLNRKGINVTCRPNIGYDFMSYKLGLSLYDLIDFDEVVICNDSVYGPFQPLEKVFCSENVSDCDFWGITDSFQTTHHIQSYFVAFRKQAVNTMQFKDFWAEVKTLNNKQDIIDDYEIGLTKTLLDASLSFKTIYQSSQRSTASVLTILTEDNFNFFRKLSKRLFDKDLYEGLPRKIKNFGLRNPTHAAWEDTILTNDSPFLKTELLRDNPTKVASISKIIPIIENEFNYPIELIKDHLARHDVTNTF